MKFGSVFLLMLVFSVPLSAQTLQNGLMPDFSVRGGLPNVYRKLSGGGKLTIAYLGGSITEAAGGWREQSAAALKRKFPAAEIKAINAGIGGTGSDLGVFRLKAQVLDYHPDLVFVEFAVNDATKPASLICKTMEGIVRQIWKADLSTDICFVYTLTGDMGAGIQNGNIPPSTAAMELIAAHYSIPGVSMGLKVVQMAEEGKLVYKGKKEEYPDKMVFSADNVHPFPDTGQRLYAEALSAALDSMFRMPALSSSKNRLLEPYDLDNWESAKMLSINEASRSGLWEKVDPGNTNLQKVFREPFADFIRSAQPGASLSFKFKGKVAGLYDIVGPDCGQYEMQVDNKPVALYPRFDSYSTYYRPQYFLAQDLKDGKHTIRLKVSAVKPDKKAILKQRNQVMENETDYRDNACYAGYIMLIGEIQK